MYNEKHLKTKIKSYNGKFIANFQNNEIPKESSKFICLSVILIDSVFRTGKNYYPQLSVEEYKYVVKGEKISLSIFLMTYITSDSDREDSYGQNSFQENTDEENCDAEN